MDSNLAQNQQAAAQLIASGGMQKTDIAKAVGVSRTTIYNWEKDSLFGAEVDRLKRELKSFGQDLITGKLVEAVQDYWKLITDTKDSRVAAEGYRYFIDRSLGKPTSKLDITAEAKASSVDADTIDDEFGRWDDEDKD